MMEYVFASGLLGFALGYLGGKRQAAPERPMRLVDTRTYAMTPPGLVAHSWTEAEQWRAHVVSFAWHGGLIGFSYRQMAAAGIVRRAGWEVYTALLVDAGILQRRERSSTTWAGGWSSVKLRVALEHKLLALPYPPGRPPELNSPRLMAAQLAQRSAAGAVGAVGGLYAGGR
jgi:hypothetical protein